MNFKSSMHVHKPFLLKSLAKNLISSKVSVADFCLLQCVYVRVHMTILIFGHADLGEVMQPGQTSVQ